MPSIVGQGACSPAKNHSRVISVGVDANSGELLVNMMNPVEAIFMLPGAMYITPKTVDSDDVRVMRSWQR
jgi:hypothetical protein